MPQANNILALFFPYSFAMKAFYVAFLLVCGWCLPHPLFCDAVALSLFHSCFFPSFLLHGDSLLYKCKYFLVAVQFLAVLVHILVLRLLPCCLADLPGCVLSSSVCGSCMK